MTTRTPPILHGARLLAGLSLAWSAFAITDLMDSGIFGLSVALAGDIGWITVLWAEYRRIGPRWAAPLAGWLIALGVGALLVLHGIDARSISQAIAGPFVVLVGKAVWTFALAALRDPAALTPEQEAEIHGVMRDSEYAARLHAARRDEIARAADAEIDRIRAESRITLARDDADFEIALERMEKRAAIQRRSPLALAVAPVRTAPDSRPDTVADTSGQSDSRTNNLPERPDATNPAPAATSDDTRPDTSDTLSAIASAATRPSDLVKALADNGVPLNDIASEGIRLRPDMKADSVRVAADRLKKKAGPYL